MICEICYHLFYYSKDFNWQECMINEKLISYGPWFGTFPSQILLNIQPVSLINCQTFALDPFLCYI